MEIGKQIKSYRLRKGVRQEDLAEYLGVSPQAVSKWETESSLPDIALLPRLAVYLGVAIDDLFRIPQEDQLTRIENALINTAQLDEPVFQSYKAFLEGLTEDKERKARAHTLPPSIITGPTAIIRRPLSMRKRPSIWSRM